MKKTIISMTLAMTFLAVQGCQYDWSKEQAEEISWSVPLSGAISLSQEDPWELDMYDGYLQLSSPGTSNYSRVYIPVDLMSHIDILSKIVVNWKFWEKVQYKPQVRLLGVDTSGHYQEICKSDPGISELPCEVDVDPEVNYYLEITAYGSYNMYVRSVMVSGSKINKSEGESNE